MKRPLRILLLVSVAILAAFLVVRSLSKSLWERTLYGPFTGVPYSSGITTAPTSILTIPSHGQLEVHELQSYTNPVVLLRSASGDIQWSRLLLPEKKRQDGTIEHAGLREFRLRSWEPRSTGSVVFVSCDWDWGGNERGLIELNADYGFKSFSLSW
jgi:hypothetical protein